MKAEKSIVQLSQQTFFSKTATLFSFGLLVLGLTGSIIQAGTPIILLIPALLPLLIFLPGVVKGNPHSLILLCFVSLLYFCVIAVNVSELDRSVYDLIGLVAVVVLFTATLLFARWQKALLKRQNQSDHFVSTAPTPHSNKTADVDSKS